MRIVDLLMARETLQKLGSVEGLNSIIAYKIAKNIKTIDKELSTYDETRIKIVKEYADKDDEGNPVVVNNQYQLEEDNVVKVNQEIAEVQQLETNVDISTVALGDIEKAGLSPLEIMSIEFMLEV